MSRRKPRKEAENPVPSSQDLLLDEALSVIPTLKPYLASGTNPFDYLFDLSRRNWLSCDCPFFWDVQRLVAFALNSLGESFLQDNDGQNYLRRNRTNMLRLLLDQRLRPVRLMEALSEDIPFGTDVVTNDLLNVISMFAKLRYYSSNAVFTLIELIKWDFQRLPPGKLAHFSLSMKLFEENREVREILARVKQIKIRKRHFGTAYRGAILDLHRAGLLNLLDMDDYTRSNLEVSLAQQSSGLAVKISGSEAVFVKLLRSKQYNPIQQFNAHGYSVDVCIIDENQRKLFIEFQGEPFHYLTTVSRSGIVEQEMLSGYDRLKFEVLRQSGDVCFIKSRALDRGVAVEDVIRTTMNVCP